MGKAGVYPTPLAKTIEDNLAQDGVPVEKGRGWAEINQCFFDETAEEYDQWLEGGHGKIASQLAAIAQPVPGEAVLDLGCGTGFLAALIAEKVGASGSLVGVDISAKMLAQAKLRNPDSANIAFHQSSADDFLWFRDSSFDLVVLSDSLSYFQSPSRALKEAFRVLRPGGRLVLSVVRRSLGTRAQEVSGQLLEQELKNQPLNLPSRSITRTLLGEPKNLSALLKESGFTPGDFSTSITGVKTQDCTQWLELVRFSGPRHYLLLSALGRTSRARLYNRMERAMQKLGGDSFRYHLACTLVSCSKTKQ